MLEKEHVHIQSAENDILHEQANEREQLELRLEGVPDAPRALSKGAIRHLFIPSWSFIFGCLIYALLASSCASETITRADRVWVQSYMKNLGNKTTGTLLSIKVRAKKQGNSYSYLTDVCFSFRTKSKKIIVHQIYRGDLHTNWKGAPGSTTLRGGPGSTVNILYLPNRLQDASIVGAYDWSDFFLDGIYILFMGSITFSFIFMMLRALVYCCYQSWYTYRYGKPIIAKVIQEEKEEDEENGEEEEESSDSSTPKLNWSYTLEGEEYKDYTTEEYAVQFFSQHEYIILLHSSKFPEEPVLYFP